MIEHDTHKHVAEHRRILLGGPGDRGLIRRTKDLEDWKMKRVMERVSMKALILGVSIGLGLNTIGIVAILRLVLKQLGE